MLILGFFIFIFLSVAYVADIGKCVINSTSRNIPLSPHKSTSDMGGINPSLLTIYTLEAQACATENMDLVIALMSNPTKISSSSNSDNSHYILWLNMEGSNDSVPFSDVNNDTIIATTGECLITFLCIL